MFASMRGSFAFRAARFPEMNIEAHGLPRRGIKQTDAHVDFIMPPPPLTPSIAPGRVAP